jgi:hypothetical protein
MKKVKADGKEVRKIRPALTPEARENQMVALAMDLAEKQLLEGTASSQVITHYLKIGSTEQKRRIEKLERENELLRAKTESLETAKRIEELYSEAINAFKVYRGDTSDEEDDY